ncbi:hypothetical protein C9374_006151 [Naegleria lovaniensis]|uniref:Calponin-homology (CH) domain-containing protein n=1 Tax=Naegleria lovaniensis TaxID=51637 RepID=A0AA88KI31_NAELO|nr:uncharacterized protein C9374_006151 [Naegleria lovaniensis]KAG2381767.1 hypothetical protein C9374_006151 [Naegleria lovaniensis]
MKKNFVLPYKLLPIGRVELLGWINSLLETNYSKIEDCSDGIAYYLLFNACFPQHFPLTKINFNAIYPLEKKGNLDKLQKLLAELKIPYSMATDKIANGKLQDNIEFLQWIYTFIAKNFERVATEGLYERRERVVIHFGRKNHIVPPIEFIKNEEIRKKLFPKLSLPNNSLLHFEDNEFSQAQAELLLNNYEDIEHFSEQLEREIRDKVQRNENNYIVIQQLLGERSILFEKLLIVESVCTIRSSDIDENTKAALDFLIRILRAKM